MKILVDLNEELFNRIKEVNKNYTLQNFILIAIENQVTLEKEEDLDLSKRMKSLSKEQYDPAERNVLENKKPKQPATIIKVLNNPLDFDKIIPISLKKPLKNYYIWGQYNKFFAIKFAVRNLALMQIKNNFSPVRLDEYQIECAKEASKMKNILIESDTKANRKWGEVFASGLPEDEEKSHSRFIHHFIGYVDSKGNPVGALSDLGFVVIENEQIALSPFGLEFAKLKNPVIDENPFSPTLFSQVEREFLINHIKNNISIEWKGMTTVVQWIQSGFITPDSLNEKMATMDSKWTDKMANTYRTGMLARMFDLGFISRKKIGVNVNYIITDFAKKVVEIV